MIRPSPDLKTLLTNLQPYDEYEAQYKRQFLHFLETGTNCFDRSNLVAHFVADAWILNHDLTKVVLIEHLVDKNWKAPGGHCDGETDSYNVALREAFEEAGLDNLTPLYNGLFDISGGCVRFAVKKHGPEPEHLHFDLCYAFVADENAPLKISDESTGLAWVNVADIPQLNYEPVHMRRVEKTLKRWNLPAQRAA